MVFNINSRDNNTDNGNIVDNERNMIVFEDFDNPSMEEKMCVLACRTGNPSENSFAAEVKYHADGVINLSLNEALYKSAIKADLSVDEKISFIENSFSVPEYKDYNST
nr:hypothetical protein [Clostridia bacterium]